VFVVGRHQEAQRPYLSYLKLGEGPDYLLLRPFHLAHLEIPKTIRHVLAGRGEWRFNNGPRPTVQVLAVAKRDLAAGEPLPRGIGSFAVRGEAVRIADHPDAVPIGLLQGATLARAVAAGEVVAFDDVKLPQSRALELWRATLSELAGRHGAFH
jgi:predicted homoserine dehydrogenase-like protein